MKGAYGNYEDKRLAVIGIGFQDAEANIRAFARDNSMQWPVVFDTGEKIGDLYGMKYGAGMVFIDANGVVAERFLTGFNDERFKEALNKIVRQP